MKEKIYIKNLNDLNKLKKTHYAGVITVNSDIQFDIDHVDLIKGDWLFHLRVNGNLKAESISVWSVEAHNIEAFEILDCYEITAQTIDLYGSIQAQRIRSYNLIAPEVIAEDIIATSIDASGAIRADNAKIGNEYKKSLSPIFSYLFEDESRWKTAY